MVDFQVFHVTVNIKLMDNFIRPTRLTPGPRTHEHPWRRQMFFLGHFSVWSCRYNILVHIILYMMYITYTYTYLGRYWPTWLGYLVLCILINASASHEPKKTQNKESTTKRNKTLSLCFTDLMFPAILHSTLTRFTWFPSLFVYHLFCTHAPHHPTSTYHITKKQLYVPSTLGPLPCHLPLSVLVLVWLFLTPQAE